MANVLILEPFPEVGELIGRFLTRSGHTPLSADAARANPHEVDAIVLEPALLRGIELVEHLRESRPTLPLVCEGLEPPTDRVLDLKPVAYLMKPWSLAQLAGALELALEGVPASA